MPISVTPYIPQAITVHTGPASQWAENVTVSFPDYIKNVASSEIYPTCQRPPSVPTSWPKLPLPLTGYTRNTTPAGAMTSILPAPP